MAFYTSPADMYDKRADRYTREGNQHWAMAKNGQGDYHYGKAKVCYNQAAENRAKADRARETGAAFWKKK